MIHLNKTLTVIVTLNACSAVILTMLKAFVYLLLVINTVSNLLSDLFVLNFFLLKAWTAQTAGLICLPVDTRYGSPIQTNIKSPTYLLALWQ